MDLSVSKGKNTSFDELVSKYKYVDVSFTLLNATIKRETGSGLDMEKKLKSLGLVNEDVIDDKEYTGSIISQVENSINFVQNYTKKSWTIIEYKRIKK